MIDPTLYCPCGRPIINNKCSRKKPVKACKGEQAEKRPRYSGKSNFYNFKDKESFGDVGYAK